MKENEFYIELAKALYVNINTLREKLKYEDISEHLNYQTIDLMRKNFNEFLFLEATNNFEVGYKEVNAYCRYPNAFQDKNGNMLESIEASRIGVLHRSGKATKNYLYEELNEEVYFDSEIEFNNITKEINEIIGIKEIVVFAKIPKESIKIPVAGGGTYSPDFAYVIELTNGKKQLNLVVESKGKEKDSDLSEGEKKKINHAKNFFNQLNKNNSDTKLEIRFKTQLQTKTISDLIKDINNNINTNLDSRI